MFQTKAYSTYVSYIHSMKVKNYIINISTVFKYKLCFKVFSSWDVRSNYIPNIQRYRENISEFQLRFLQVWKTSLSNNLSGFDAKKL